MIWGFGDSFTWGYGCRPGWGPLNEDDLIPEYYTKYKKEGDKIWLEWLGEWFNEEIKNVSRSGASNDKIFDSVLENFDDIKDHDKVIIGMTTWGRTDVPTNYGWVSLLSAWEYGGMKTLKESISNNISDDKLWETIINYQYYFSNSSLWEQRWSTRFNFIIKQLKKKKCQTILFQIQEPIVLSMQTIRQETGISDDHFSFGGHKKFAEVLYKKFSLPLI
jgi:hypothetical protein